MDAFPPDLKLPSGMKLYELPTGDYPLAFWGRFLDEEDTDDGKRNRWAHLKLFEIIDTDRAHNSSLPPEDENYRMYGQRMYLLYTIGHTLVYHDEDAACRGGVRMRVADFPRKTADFPLTEEDPDLVPCEECSPEDYHSASPEDYFRLEITWYSDTPCQTADKLIRSLYREPRCSNCRHKPHEGRKCYQCGTCPQYKEAPRSLSGPGRNLLEKVRDSEPEIAKAMGTKRRL